MDLEYLIPASQELIRILHAADIIPSLHTNDGLRQAIHRYAVWMTVLENIGEGALDLSPPNDIFFIWIVHKLAPLKYYNDCMRIHGRLLDVQRSETLLEIQQQNTKELWPPDEPWTLVESLASQSCSSSNTLYSCDLFASAKKQFDFLFQISRPQFLNEEYLTRSLDRYRRFTQLATQPGGVEFAVPTYDIDLMWHSHMIDVLSYRNYFLNSAGFVLNHDDGSSSQIEKILLKKYKETSDAYETTFNMPYVLCGCEKMSPTRPTEWKYKDSLSEMLCEMMPEICVENITTFGIKQPWSPTGISLSIINCKGLAIDFFSCVLCTFCGFWEQQSDTVTITLGDSSLFIPLENPGVRSALLVSTTCGSSLIILEPFVSHPSVEVIAWYPFCVDDIGMCASLCIKLSGVARTL